MITVGLEYHYLGLSVNIQYSNPMVLIWDPFLKFLLVGWSRMFVGTWNVGGKSPQDGLNLKEWLRQPAPADIYVLGLVISVL